ncbi:MAG: hypothetical protein KF781_05885 [Chitinophagaceae bacterium]|nr:hypothetical protein [Chitinophagaceae bacterium]MCW5906074.1 hypothetical protein [Chitinophagaceae bacterium]
MKKLFIAIFLFIGFTSFLQAQTVEEVINSFVEANGGIEKLTSIKSLQIESVMNLEQMGSSATVTFIREKDKLFRVQSTNPMGGNEESYTIITDTVGYTYVPAFNSPMGSMEASLTKFTPEELAAAAYQKDCEGFFAPLVNYAIKGHTPTLEKSEKVNGVDCYKVDLKLKTGQELTYFISKANYQVRRVQTSVPIAFEMMGMSAMNRAFRGGGGRERRNENNNEERGGERPNRNQRERGNRKIDIDYEKYKLFNGIPFPTKQTVQLGMMQLALENTHFKINEPINPKWYLVQ